jgi:hypothetical protein
VTAEIPSVLIPCPVTLVRGGVAYTAGLARSWDLAPYLSPVHLIQRWRWAVEFPTRVRLVRLVSVCLCHTADTRAHTARPDTTTADYRYQARTHSVATPATLARQRRSLSLPRKSITGVIVVVIITIATTGDTVVMTGISYSKCPAINLAR